MQYDKPSRPLRDTTLVEQIHPVEGLLNKAYATINVELPSKYFRPGSGLFSEMMRQILGRLDYRMVPGSICPHDPQIPYWRINARHILRMLRPGGIIICYDRRSWTALMLRRALPEIRRRGYRIITITELLRETKA